MTIYIILLLISLFLLSIRHNYLSLNIKPIIITITVIFLFIIEMFRSTTVGVDYPMYYGFFTSYNYEGMRSQFIEPAYAVLTTLVQHVYYFYFIPFFVLFIGIIGIIILNRQFKFNGLTLLSLFILTGIYAQSFDILRQYIAIGIICIGAALFLRFYNHKLLKYVLFFLFLYLAFNFHKSAVIGILFLILPKIHFRSKTIVLTGIISFIFAMNSNLENLVNKFASIVPYYSSKYGTSSISQTSSLIGKGPSITSILLRLVPVIFQFILLYLFVKHNYNYENYKTRFILSGYLVYLILSLLMSFWGNGFRRVQIYFLIFPMFYSCMYLDNSYLIKKRNVIFNSINRREKYSSTAISKCLLVIMWIVTYIAKLLIDNEKIVPYKFL